MLAFPHSRLDARLKPSLNDMIYQQIHDMSGRGVLAKLYDQRNKEILDRLVAMRAKSDKEAKMNLDQLKDFCKEFVDTVAERKKAWKQKFVGFLVGYDQGMLFWMV
eukprot:Skav222077  [mRNA]  locus=scaffold4586:77369:79461:- [translate_table: standard]